MNYLRTSRRPARARARVAIIAAVCAGAIVIAFIFFIPHFFPALWTSIARPFWRMEFSVESGSLRSPGTLLSENEALKRQLSEDSVRLASIQAVEQENQDLKALMGRASTTPYVLAAVLARPPAAPYDELVIDVGADRGLSTTSLIYSPGNVPIGRVSDVLGQTSKAILFSSPGTMRSVFVGPKHIPATAVGKGGGYYQADLPQATDISEGDFVLDSGPGSVPLGIVTSVSSDPSDPFERILFAPPVNIYQLRWVLVSR